MKALSSKEINHENKNYRAIHTLSTILNLSFSENGNIEEEIGLTKPLLRPGVIKSSKTVNQTGVLPNDVKQITIPLNSVIIYTDYDNIQLRLACATIDNFWMSKRYMYYFVLVRTRRFDSLKKFTQVTDILKRNKISLNDLIFLHNAVDCKN